jgi:hypothetical protein
VRAPIRLGLLAAGLTLLAAAPAGAATSNDIVGFLNQQRAANGIPASVAVDSYRTTGCANHNNYMAQNGLGHGEDPSKPGYTPEGADYSNSGEVLARGGPDWSATTNPWDSAPLHQTLLFDPRVNSAGADEAEGFSCVRFGFDFSEPLAPELYAFTADSGPTAVPPRVTVSGEGPYAPQEAVGIRQGVPTGPNILFFARGFGSSDHAVSYSLTGPSGPVEAKMVDSTTQGPDGSGPVFDLGGDLIPVKPLVPFASYAVAVTWQNDSGARLDQSLSFKTTGILRGLKLSLGKLSRTRRVRLRAPAEAVGQRATVRFAAARRGGRAKTVGTTHTALRRSQTLRVPRPPRGGTVTVTVSVGSFTAGDTKFTVTPAKRSYR